jgi:ribosomal-protein-alanine N-acetyltransferase
MNRIETIESSRLKLNAINSNDIDFLCQYYTDPELTKFLPSGKPYKKNKVVELLNNRIKHWNKHHFGTYLLSLKSSGEIIGYCGLEYVKDTEFIDIRYGVKIEHWG